MINDQYKESLSSWVNDITRVKSIWLAYYIELSYNDGNNAMIYKYNDDNNSDDEISIYTVSKLASFNDHK